VRCLFGAACLVVGLTLSLGKTDSASFQGLLAFHLALAAILAIGACFNDRLGRALRVLGAVLLTLASLLAVPGDPWLSKLAFVSPEAVRVYPMILVLVAAGYGFVFGSRPHLYAATLSVAGWTVLVILRGYLEARQLVAGLDRIAWGMGFFLLAALISLAKAGLLRPVAALLVHAQDTRAPANQSSPRALRTANRSNCSTMNTNSRGGIA
jgi:hypothetical protein